MGDTIIPDTKATGSRCTKAGCQGIKQWHPADQKQDHLQYRHNQIDQIQDFRRILDLRR